MRLTAGSRHAHRVTEPRRVHALRVRDVSACERQTQHGLDVSLGPVADQLAVGNDAIALCPTQHAFVVEVASELNVLQSGHAASILQLLLLEARSTTSLTSQPSFTDAWRCVRYTVDGRSCCSHSTNHRSDSQICVENRDFCLPHLHSTPPL